MSILDRFLPPPGAPGAVRAGARWWRETGNALTRLADDTRSRSWLFTSSWHGCASSTFHTTARTFLASVDEASSELREVADLLDAVADAIEQAQNDFHHRMAMVVGTAVVAVALTVPTFGASDEVGAAAVAVELGAVLEVASAASAAATAALAQVCAQAARLALQAAVFAGVNVVMDAAGAWLVYRDERAWQHLDLRGDLEWALVGGVAAPLRRVMSLGPEGAPEWAAGSVSRAVTPLALTSLSMASADVLVRLALGEHVDGDELAMAAIPVGPRAKRLLGEKPAMIGDKGPQITSRRLKGRGDWEMDVENPNPGGRPAQIHLHIEGQKLLYVFAEGRFEGLSNRLEARLMKNPHFRRALDQAFRALREEAL